MHGLIGQAAHDYDDRIAFECRGLGGGQADEYLCQGGAAGDGGNTSPRPVAGFGNPSGGELQRELHDVAAGRIFHSDGSVGTCDLAYIARVLEMVEQFGGVHEGIVLQ